MDDKLDNYLMQTLPADENWVTDLEHIASKHNIPIMDPLGMNFVMQLIRLTKPARILEIGTAIGYSALRMLQAHPGAQIVTIEKNEQHVRQAKKNIRNANKQNNIHVLFGDAIEVLEEIKEGGFDLVFIDAAKGKYQHFFELSAPLLAEGGFVLSDNVLFKGYVADNQKDHPRYRTIAEKIRSYNDWLVNHPDFTTTIVPIGDGIAISIKGAGKELSFHA